MHEHRWSMKSLTRWVPVAALLCLPVAAGAQKGNAADDVARLYALPPAGFIHVRVVNAGSVPVAVQVGEQRVERLSTAGRMASDYFAQPGGGDFQVRVDGKRVRVDQPAPQGGFVTLLLKDGGTPSADVVVDKAASGAELKAQLTLYNLVRGCTAELRLAAGAVVLPSVPAFSSEVRAVNPVAAQLTGGCGDVASAPLQLPALRAGDRYSLFLFGPAGAPVLKGQQARTEPYR